MTWAVGIAQLTHREIRGGGKNIEAKDRAIPTAMSFCFYPRAPKITNILSLKIAPKPLGCFDLRIPLNHYIFITGKII